MKRILILSQHPMFGQCVTTLLSCWPGLTIVGEEKDTTAALERIKELEPDIVIVDTSDPRSDPSHMVMRVLEQCAGKVIGMGIQDNVIHIYRGEQRIVTELSDLFNAIEEDPAGVNPRG